MRPEVPASQATIVGVTPYSVISLTSIDAKPKIAFVGSPGRGRDRLRQREEGAVDEAVAVDQEQRGRGRGHCVVTLVIVARSVHAAGRGGVVAAGVGCGHVGSVAMRVTVTGAGGLIGSRLVAMLRARGDEVTILSRSGCAAARSAGIRSR